MKKRIAVALNCKMLLVVFLSAFFFTGCGSVGDAIDKLLEGPDGACHHDTNKCIVVTENACQLIPTHFLWEESVACIG